MTKEKTLNEVCDLIVKEYYCIKCGKLIRADETQNEFPIRMTVYETCQACALAEFKKAD